MTREELIKKIALKMDEISSSDDVIVPVYTGDNNPLYTQINNLLNESVNDVLMKAPIHRLHSHVEIINSSDTHNVFNNLRKVAVIKVPFDFLRLVSISDKLFYRNIVELSVEGDTIDQKQHNRHLIAKYAKPVAVIGNNGNRVITCYSYDMDDSPSPQMIYIKRYDHDKTLKAETELDGYITDIVSWACAGKVFYAQGDLNKGKICDDNAAALMI
jgi:hypothetical protein